jgi:hypothetical protein
MSNLALEPLSNQTADIRGRLQALRARIATWFWVDGLSRALGLLLILLAVDLVIDWYFRMDPSQRVVMLALIVAAVAWVVYRRLILPLSATMSDDALALQVEAGNRQLGQSVITALQLSQMKDLDSKGMSPLMVRETVRAGAVAAQQVDFSKVLDADRFRVNGALLAAAFIAFALLAYGVTANDSLGIWFNRNLLLGERQWPQKTYLLIQRAENGEVVFPRGEDWTQVVEVDPRSEIVPETVFLDFRKARGRSSQQMKQTSEQTFEATFTAVLEPFEFRARGGDATTAWVQVRLVEQPALEELSLEVTPPQYTGESPQLLPPGKGPYYVLKGSSLKLAGKANKPLRRGSLLVEGQSWPLQLTSSQGVSGEVKAGDVVAGQYIVELEDELGLASRRPTSFGLRLRTDREPRVRVRLVGVSGMVVPKARVPMVVRVTDDFGISAAQLDYQWRGDDPMRPEGSGTLQFESLKDKLGRAELSFDEAMELAPLEIPPGSGLNFHVSATDNDDISGPNAGKSSDFLLRVVTEEELRTDLLRREKEQRQEFERLLKNQDDLITDGRALEAGVKGSANLQAEQRDLLMQMQRRQKVLTGNVGAIADRLDAIVIEVDNNRLEEADGKIQTRLKRDIIQPMRTLVETSAPEAMQRLDQSRRLADKASERDVALGQALTKQEEMATVMREILRHMVRSEGYQEAVNLLYEIQKSQQDVYDRTLKERQERIKGILEGKGSENETPEGSGAADK